MPQRSHEKLAKALHSPRDIPTDVVWIVRLHIGRRHEVSGQNSLTEARGKALNLGLGAMGHVNGATIRNVAVSPGRMHPAGRPARIKETRLREKNEGFFGGTPRQTSSSALQYFLQTTANMNCARSETGRLLPRDRAVKGPVYLEDPGSVAECDFESLSIVQSETAIRQCERVAGGDVEKNGTCLWKIIDG